MIERTGSWLQITNIIRRVVWNAWTNIWFQLVITVRSFLVIKECVVIINKYNTVFYVISESFIRDGCNFTKFTRCITILSIFPCNLSNLILLTFVSYLTHTNKRAKPTNVMKVKRRNQLKWNSRILIKDKIAISRYKDMW